MPASGVSYFPNPLSPGSGSCPFQALAARKVTVLHEGGVLCEGSVAEVQANPLVQEVYLGRSRDKRSGAVV